MLDKNARKFRDWLLILALLAFAGGVVDVVMLGFDISLGTGVMTKMGFQPESFLNAAIFLALGSIAFGVIHLGQAKG